MIPDLNTKLRIEKSINSSGILFNANSIEVIKNNHYYIESFPLDGDAPKQFIRMYNYEQDTEIRKQNCQTGIHYIAKTAEIGIRMSLLLSL